MKAAIYCRLSEEDRNKPCQTDDSESIQNQKNLLTSYAAERRWQIYDIYSDDDYAGADRSRPAFNRLLRDAEERKFDIILCKTQSRFTRELELVETYIHGRFPAWGIRFVSVVDGADTAVKGNKKARQINGLINEWYLEDMSENIKSVLTNKRRSGRHIGSFALYGYQKDPTHKGRLLVDEEAAAVVREVFELFAQGFGKTAIARLLNDRGVPNPTEYKRRKGLRYRQPADKNSTLWRYYTVSNMLRNETYIGNLVQGRYGSVSYKTRQCKPLPPENWIRVENTHEPVIDRELWDRVQALLTQRARPFLSGTIGLFAGKAVCMHCGYSMRSSKNRGLHYLKCATRHAARDACIGSFLSVNTLEAAVLGEFARLAAEYLDRDGLERQVHLSGDLQCELTVLKSSLDTHQKRVWEYTSALRDLYLDRAKGLVPEIEFHALCADLRAENASAQRAAADTQRRIQTLQAHRQPGTDRHILDNYVAAKQLTREMVEIFIERVVIGKRRPETGAVPIEIHWNF